jgi:hypothetical protein
MGNSQPHAEFESLSPTVTDSDDEESAMSTRSKSKLAAASTSKVVTQASTKQAQKAKAPPRKQAPAILSDADQLGKENVKVKKPPKIVKKKTRKTVLCTCQRGDDGSPMVYCGQCKIW